jgi:hypothetical protein
MNEIHQGWSSQGVLRGEERDKTVLTQEAIKEVENETLKQDEPTDPNQ